MKALLRISCMLSVLLIASGGVGILQGMETKEEKKQSKLERRKSRESSVAAATSSSSSETVATTSSVKVHETLLDLCTDFFGNLPEWRFSLENPKDSPFGDAKMKKSCLHYEQLKMVLDQLEKTMTEEESNEKRWVSAQRQKNSFAQRALIKQGDVIAVWGDLHGSAHSFLRGLVRLYLLGYLKNNLQLKENCYVVIVGDFVDRGWHSTEVFYSAALLKNKNPGKVFMLRGNHEDVGTNNEYGFTHEFKRKYPGKENIVQKMYDLLPGVLYLYQKSTTNNLQFCHGSIEAGFATKGFIEEENESIVFSQTTDSASLTNGDFFINLVDNTKIACNPRGTRENPNVPDTEMNLKANGIQECIRGHQHDHAGKLFPSQDQLNVYRGMKQLDAIYKKYKIFGAIKENQEALFAGLQATVDDREKKAVQDFVKVRSGVEMGKMRAEMNSGLFYWRDVVDEKGAEAFDLVKYRPIITLSSGVEPKLVLCDAFLVLKVQEKNIMASFVETNLSPAMSKVAWLQKNTDKKAETWPGQTFAGSRFVFCPNYCSIDKGSAAGEITVCYTSGPSEPVGDTLKKLMLDEKTAILPTVSHSASVVTTSRGPQRLASRGPQRLAPKPPVT